MDSLRRAVRSWAATGWRDRVEVVRIVLLAALVEIGVRSFRLPVLARLLRIDLELTSTDSGRLMTARPPDWAVKRIRLTAGVLRYSGQTCLRNSLVLACRLRDLSPVVRIGLKKHDGRVLAHAWLEIGGFYFDPLASEYAPIHAAHPAVRPLNPGNPSPP